MAFGGNTAWYISSAKYAALTTWATGQVKAVGDFVKQSGTPTVGNERAYICIVAGTTGGGADPLTTFTRGVKITDNTVTWQEATGIPALNGDLTNTPTWAQAKAVSAAMTLGHVIKDNAGTHIFICSVAGNVGANEPTFNVAAPGNTTTDSGVTWVYLGTAFTAWKAPHSRVNNALTTNWGAAGQKFYGGSDHAETQAAAYNLTSLGTDASPIDIICVNVAGSVPPVSADLANTAKIDTTGNNAMNINGGVVRMFYGFVFTCGTSNTPGLLCGSTGGIFFEACTLALGTGNGAAIIRMGNQGGFNEFKNCVLRFSATTQRAQFQGRVVWRDTASAIDSGGSLPATLINFVNDNVALMKGLDLSALSGKILADPPGSATIQDLTVQDCKLPASFTIATVSGWSGHRARIKLLRSDSSGVNTRSEVYDYDGVLTTELTIVRTLGAVDNATAVAWKIVTAAVLSRGRPFNAFPIGKWNAVTAANVIATVQGIINAAAVPNNNELWMDVSYLGASGNPQGSVKSSGLADPLAAASALTADSASAWDGVASARLNTHAYSLGDVIKLASNPGRLFFCTTTGTSAGSEPGGYASAVDGGSVTDNTAVFRAGCRFKMAVTLTSPQPQIVGNLYALVRAGKVSTTYYIDPYIVLS